jgi:hypothetical protein
MFSTTLIYLARNAQPEKVKGNSMALNIVEARVLCQACSWAAASLLDTLNYNCYFVLLDLW